MFYAATCPSSVYTFTSYPHLNWMTSLARAFLNGPFRPGLLSLESLRAQAEGELSRRNADLFYLLNWSLLLDAKILLQHFFSGQTYLRGNPHR